MPAADYCTKTGKQRFASQHQAGNALKRLGHGNVYRCKVCDSWHLSHASLDQLKGKRLRRERLQ